MEKLIQRDSYLDRLIRSMWNEDIKVITGLRRSGKSILLFNLFYQYLLNKGINENQIIQIKLDQRKDYKYRNPIVLCEYIESIVRKNPGKEYYLFIDEVQLTQKVVDSVNGNIEVTIYDMLNELRNYTNLDVYVTGSNSKGLSTDIATEFRGRATQIPVYPLSFQEFYSFKGGNEKEALEEYMQFGGMPRLLHIKDETDKKEYLKNLYNEIYIKDIVERNDLKRENILNDILDFLASQIGSLSNPTNIANALISINRTQVSPKLITKYIQFIGDAFLIRTARRFDVKGKHYFNYPNKYYYTDIGLRNARLNYRQNDPGHIMENIIFNELISRGFSVDVGVVSDRTNKQNIRREVDFVVNQFDKKVYIQSAYQLNQGLKENSELLPLKLTGDFFKKIIIRMDIPYSFYDENGIYHVNLLDFLLNRIKLF